VESGPVGGGAGVVCFRARESLQRFSFYGGILNFAVEEKYTTEGFQLFSSSARD
jgi:hypothetical protein